MDIKKKLGNILDFRNILDLDLVHTIPAQS